jgi:hypothetical protein
MFSDTVALSSVFTLSYIAHSAQYIIHSTQYTVHSTVMQKVNKIDINLDYHRN